MTRLKIKSYINTQIICSSGTIFFNSALLKKIVAALGADINRKYINLLISNSILYTALCCIIKYGNARMRGREGTRLSYTYKMAVVNLWGKRFKLHN